MSLSPKVIKHSRSVYTLVELLATVGGLDYALMMLLYPLFALYSAGKYYRSVLKKFKYDDSKSKLEPGDAEHDRNLIDRLNNPNHKMDLSQNDLDSIQRAFNSLPRLKISKGEAVLSSFFGCLCSNRRAQKLYLKGKQRIDDRLDVVKLVKTSLDFDILRKMQLTPWQRQMMKK